MREERRGEERRGEDEERRGDNVNHPYLHADQRNQVERHIEGAFGSRHTTTITTDDRMRIQNQKVLARWDTRS